MTKQEAQLKAVKLKEEGLTLKEIAQKLNLIGYRSPKGNVLMTVAIVGNMIRSYEANGPLKIKAPTVVKKHIPFTPPSTSPIVLARSDMPKVPDIHPVVFAPKAATEAVDQAIGAAIGSQPIAHPLTDREEADRLKAKIASDILVFESMSFAARCSIAAQVLAIQVPQALVQRAAVGSLF